MKVSLHSVRKYITDIFLPNRCPACSKLIKWDMLLCSECKSKMHLAADELCSVCGRNVCSDHSQLAFDNCIALFYYEQPTINAIYALKHNKAVNLAEYSASLLKKQLEKLGIADKADLVTSVPMSKKKLRTRRYNQAEIIAKCLSQSLDKPFDAHLLLHSPSLTEHHKLSKADRVTDAQSSYFPNPKHNAVKGKTVILCDDVYTTGATVNACAKCLKQMGAKRVVAVCIAAAKLEERRYEDS